MSVKSIKLTNEPNDTELVECFKAARRSERLMLLERLDNKLADFIIAGTPKAKILRNLSDWIFESKLIANSPTKNKEVK